MPGVPGIGPKSAAQLINEFGDLEAVLAAAPAMKPSKRRDMLIEHAEEARHFAPAGDAARRRAAAAAGRGARARASRTGALAAWLHAQGFRSTLLRLGLEDADAAAAPRRRRRRAPQAALAPPTPPARRPRRGAGRPFGPYETVTTLTPLRAWVAEATAPPAWSRWTPKPTGWTRCAPAWSGFSLATAPGRACYVPLRHECRPARRHRRPDRSGGGRRRAGAAADRPAC